MQMYNYRMSIIIMFFSGFLGLNAQEGIVYLSNSSGNFDLFWTDENGDSSKQLTSNLGWDWSPQWDNSSGSIIHNSTDTAGNFAVLRVSLEGVSDSIDTKGKDEYILSPDGSQFLYTLQDGSNRYIGIFNLNKNENRLLIVDPSYNGRMQWSPNGKYFSFISDRDGNNELYIYDLDKAISKRLSNTEKSEKYTSWMPDSQSIIYTYHYSDERDKEHNDIFKVDIESGKLNQITNDTKFYQEIAVSPDGRKIAFHGKRDKGDQIYLMNIDGSGEVQLTSGDAYHGEPAWSHN